MRGSLIVAAMMCTLAGCARSRTSDPGLPQPDRKTITAAELKEYGKTFSNLYDYVNSRHSDWLDMNNPVTETGHFAVMVYLDGQRFGSDPTAMHQITLDNVALARRLTPSEAEIKYGEDNNAGAIEVWSSLDRMH